jgi:hypothetical protein
MRCLQSKAMESVLSSLASPLAPHQSSRRHTLLSSALCLFERIIIRGSKCSSAFAQSGFPTNARRGLGSKRGEKGKRCTFLAVTDERGNTARVLALKSRGKLSRGDIFGLQSKSLDLEHAAEFKYIYVCIEIVSPSMAS